MIKDELLKKTGKKKVKNTEEKGKAGRKTSVKMKKKNEKERGKDLRQEK